MQLITRGRFLGVFGLIQFVGSLSMLGSACAVANQNMTSDVVVAVWDMRKAFLLQSRLYCVNISCCTTATATAYFKPTYRLKLSPLLPKLAV